ncbi:MAG TPA: hypothetical protein VKJ65_00130 [Phycisphaerae bacterium]|nr:hypothetical protein [Phycisphaerae bacterium]
MDRFVEYSASTSSGQTRGLPPQKQHTSAKSGLLAVFSPGWRMRLPGKKQHHTATGVI